MPAEEAFFEPSPVDGYVTAGSFRTPSRSALRSGSSEGREMHMRYECPRCGLRSTAGVTTGTVKVHGGAAFLENESIAGPIRELTLYSGLHEHTRTVRTWGGSSFRVMVAGRSDSSL